MGAHHISSQYDEIGVITLGLRSGSWNLKTSQTVSVQIGLDPTVQRHNQKQLKDNQPVFDLQEITDNRVSC